MFVLCQNRTAAIETCDTSGDVSPCPGGVDGSRCSAGHEGPRCEVCSRPDRYYDATSTTCKDCGNVERYAVERIVLLLAIVVALAGLRLASFRMPRLLVRVSIRLAQFATSVQHLGLQAKYAIQFKPSGPFPADPTQVQAPHRFKLVLSFAQVWLVRDSIYGLYHKDSNRELSGLLYTHSVSPWRGQYHAGSTQQLADGARAAQL